MSDVSAVSNFFATANEGFTTTLATTITSGATTVVLTSASGLTNGSVFVGIIEPGGANQQVFTGIVNTALSEITNVVWTRGTNVGHTAGVTIVDYTTGTMLDMITAGILKQHNQDGTHAAVTATSLTTTGAVTAGNGLTVSAGGVSVPSNSILSAALGLASGKAGGVSTQVNAGTAGGNMWWINLGGIKLLWGRSASLSTTTTNVSYGFTLPAFFATVQSAYSYIDTQGASAGQIASGNSVSTSAVLTYLVSPGGPGTCNYSVLIIGT